MDGAQGTYRRQRLEGYVWRKKGGLDQSWGLCGLVRGVGRTRVWFIQVHGRATEQREDHTPVANVRLLCKEKSQPEAWYNLRLWTRGSLALNKRIVGPFLYTLRNLLHVLLASAEAIQGLLL